MLFLKLGSSLLNIGDGFNLFLSKFGEELVCWHENFMPKFVRFLRCVKKRFFISNLILLIFLFFVMESA